MTSRTQITLDPEVHRRAHRRANELGVSFAGYVRRLILRDLGEPEPYRDPSRVVGLQDSGGSDGAREKDTMVAEALARLERRTPLREVPVLSGHLPLEEPPSRAELHEEILRDRGYFSPPPSQLRRPSHERDP